MQAEWRAPDVCYYAKRFSSYFSTAEIGDKKGRMNTQLSLAHHAERKRTKFKQTWKHQICGRGRQKGNTTQEESSCDLRMGHDFHNLLPCL
jgi:hypothetical protein